MGMHEPSPWEGERWWPVLKVSRGGQMLLVFPSDPVPAGKSRRGWYLPVSWCFEALGVL